MQISHPDKVYWPQDGFTKGQLADYYDRLAPFILPYIAERPQSLLRFPHGIGGESFFQKDVTDHPDFISTVTIHSSSDGRDVHYLVVNNADDLRYLINFGCIDINPWNSRVGSLDRPDWCVIDLDPEDIGFASVITAAQMVHETLEAAGLPSYPKTSGATGIHIYIPLGANYSYLDCRKLAKTIAQVVNAKLPRITSLVRKPALRRGKVYLDYLQNSRGQTLAAPYSVRPRPGRPVSTPLHWTEVTHGLDPQQFTTANTLARITEVGDIWAPVIGAGINLPAAISKLNAGYLV